MELNALSHAVKSVSECEHNPEQLALVYVHLAKDEPSVLAAAQHLGIKEPGEFIEGLRTLMEGFLRVKSAFDAQSNVAPENEPDEDEARRSQSREAILSEILEKFRTKVGEAATEAVNTAYTDYLPHVVTDTESNIGYRVQGCVRNLVAGSFRRVSEDSTLVEVQDSYGCGHYIDLGEYAQVVKPLVEAFPELLKDERIAQLERRLQVANEALNHRY